MGNAKSDDKRKADKSGESDLRGGALGGSERARAVDHVKHEKSRDPDGVLRVDEEEDTLYDDGLDVEDDSDVLANTRGNDNMR